MQKVRRAVEDNAVEIVFLQTAMILLQVIGVLVIMLIAMYVALYFLRRRRMGARIGKDQCGICRHKVKFVSDCCKAPLKYMGRTPSCSKCKRICDISCYGCTKEKCQKNCEKCVRFIY